MNVAIIGAGAIGKALGKIIKRRGVTVDLWDHTAGKVPRQLPLKDLLSEADFVFLCLPSFAIRNAVQTIRPFLKKRTIVVSVAKGVEVNTNLTVDRLLAKTLPWRQPFALLSGPMLAAELEIGVCGHAVGATASRAAAYKLLALFSGTRMRVKKSYDVRGVALCGALKNVYAIGMGIVDGTKAGDNVLGAYVAAAIEEMRAIVKILGGDPLTVTGYAGVADLIATGVSTSSRNRALGVALGTHHRAHGSEGANAAAAFSELLGRESRRFPIFHALVHILGSAAEPEELLAAVCAS